MVPFNLALVATSLVAISMQVFIGRRSRLLTCLPFFKAQIKNLCPRQAARVVRASERLR